MLKELNQELFNNCGVVKSFLKGAAKQDDKCMELVQAVDQLQLALTGSGGAYEDVPIRVSFKSAVRSNGAVPRLANPVWPTPPERRPARENNGCWPFREEA